MVFSSIIRVSLTSNQFVTQNIVDWYVNLSLRPYLLINSFLVISYYIYRVWSCACSTVGRRYPSIKIPFLYSQQEQVSDHTSCKFIDPDPFWRDTDLPKAIIPVVRDGFYLRMFLFGTIRVIGTTNSISLQDV